MEEEKENNTLVDQELEDRFILKDSLEAQDNLSYTAAAAYWEKVPPTVNGVLGGFGHISSTDINGSESFIRCLFKLENPPGHARAVDCGAGIGRITKHLLQKHFGKVDLVEQCQTFIDTAKENFKSSKKIGNYYCIGLQDFDPEPNTYDVVWCQWVLGHLPDDDFVVFLERMGRAIKKNGVIVIKENITFDTIELDKEDSSITRPLSLILELIKKANLKVIKSVQQRNFPKSIYKVRMLAMQPM